MSKDRALFITCNNWNQSDYDALVAEKFDYKILCKEICPTTGTPHIHCYIYLENKILWSAFKKRNPRCNIAKAEGTPLQNLAYLTKTDKDAVVSGIMPKQGKRNDLQVIREQIVEGATMETLIPTLTNFQSLRTAECLFKYIEKKRDFKTHVVWICGPSRSGKTRYPYDNHPDTRIHLQNANQMKWWQSYDAHEITILDEVDGNTEYYKLKELCDRYPCLIENKGGSRQFLSKILYITSLTHPKLLFQYHPEEGKEMLARIDKIIQF